MHSRDAQAAASALCHEIGAGSRAQAADKFMAVAQRLLLKPPHLSQPPRNVSATARYSISSASAPTAPTAASCSGDSPLAGLARACGFVLRVQYHIAVVRLPLELFA